MAKHEVQLTNDSKDIYVGDVDTKVTGVYAKSGHNLAIWIESEKCFFRPGENVKANNVNYKDLKDALKYWTLQDLWEIYTIPDNRRITTTKTLTVDDLKNSDHVGFIDNIGTKGYVVFNGNNAYYGIISESNYNCNDAYSISFESIIMFVKTLFDRNKISKFYRFDTRKELYQWLAED